jgi:hypothetical protein
VGGILCDAEEACLPLEKHIYKYMNHARSLDLCGELDKINDWRLWKTNCIDTDDSNDHNVQWKTHM